ncbi:MAG: hypothetical protein P4L81_05605 [Candidatus Pacebacteria bacterium]|nr:hypothetical protein [Candidatus Paceibacterota bacterium]
MLIGMHAYFTKCGCPDNHGSIVCTNGARVICYSVRAAMEALAKLTEIGFLVEGELPALAKQIEESGLPPTTPHVPAFYYPTATGMKFSPVHEPPSLEDLAYAVSLPEKKMC